MSAPLLPARPLIGLLTSVGSWTTALSMADVAITLPGELDDPKRLKSQVMTKLPVARATLTSGVELNWSVVLTTNGAASRAAPPDEKRRPTMAKLPLNPWPFHATTKLPAPS